MQEVDARLSCELVVIGDPDLSRLSSVCLTHIFGRPLLFGIEEIWIQTGEVNMYIEFGLSKETSLKLFSCWSERAPECILRSGYVELIRVLDC